MRDGFFTNVATRVYVWVCTIQHAIEQKNVNANFPYQDNISIARTRWTQYLTITSLKGADTTFIEEYCKTS